MLDNSLSRSLRNSTICPIISNNSWRTSSAYLAFSSFPFYEPFALSTHIQGRVQISKDLHQRKLGEEPTKGQEMIKQMQKVCYALCLVSVRCLKRSLASGPSQCFKRHSQRFPAYGRSESESRSSNARYYRCNSHYRRIPQPSKRDDIPQGSCWFPIRVRCIFWCLSTF